MTGLQFVKSTVQHRTITHGITAHNSTTVNNQTHEQKEFNHVLSTCVWSKDCFFYLHKISFCKTQFGDQQSLNVLNFFVVENEKLAFMCVTVSCHNGKKKNKYCKAVFSEQNEYWVRWLNIKKILLKIVGPTLVCI